MKLKFVLIFLISTLAYSMDREEWSQYTRQILNHSVYPLMMGVLGNPEIHFSPELVFEENGEGSIAAYVNKDPTDYTIYINLDRWEDNRIEFYLIHELAHLVVKYYRGRNIEDDWINEGIAELIEYRLTMQMPMGIIESYLSRANSIELIEWPNFTGNEISPDYYAQKFLFFLYLYESYGGDNLLRNLIMTPNSGIANLENLVGKTIESLSEEFSNFLMARFFLASE